jgi:hypothetical protein
MSDSKILSFEDFINQGAEGETQVSMETPMGGSDSDNLPVPAAEIETGETDRNVPNNMIEEPAEEEAPEADVELEATADDDIDQHVD